MNSQVRLGYFRKAGSYEEVKVQKIYQHSESSYWTKNNDIALLYLDRELLNYTTIKLATGKALYSKHGCHGHHLFT